MPPTPHGSQWPGPLSVVARSVWAKYDRDTDDWLPLWQHMSDSAAAAEMLWDHWLPGQVRRLLASELPEGEDDARALAIFLACTHDVGKASAAFACQVEALADRMRREGLDVPLEQTVRRDRKIAPHGLVGQLIIREWLMERHGWSERATSAFTVVAGGHHGVPPDHFEAGRLRDNFHLIRPRGSEQAWKSVQFELLDHAADTCDAAGRIGDWSGVKLSQPAQVLLTAVVIVSDWIASNPDLFPLFSDSPGRDPGRAEHAWHLLDLPEPWQAENPGPDLDAVFAQRFDLPPGAEVRPVQEAAVAAARGLDGPGLIMLEAPMGEGKTEAALIAAECLAHRTGAGGCFFALPTMATGNAMFPRLITWLEHLPGTDGERHSVNLAHSKAALNDQFRELMRAGRRSTHIEQDRANADHWSARDDQVRLSAELVAHHWLRGRKKGMLASFVAGTIDQLLFVGLKTRHLVLRHLAVAGKVVVVDEAHAYDTYMSHYLDRALSWLGAYGVPVVVLSATLPPARRRELAEAYAGVGRGAPEFAALADEEAYPLVTAVSRGEAPTTLRPRASGRSTEVSIERLDDDPTSLVARLRSELSEGGNALVIRNTVRRVHEVARELRAEFGDENVTVAHARFLDLDRLDKDEGLLRRFGSPAKVEQLKGERPRGPHVVVATQVAEQSLDIDFDLLVTDLAPVDLLLQRMGRLHRHMRGRNQSERPAGLRKARCLITAVDWEKDPPDTAAVKANTYIYSPYLLVRSGAVLEGRLAAADAGDEGDALVRLPEDISPLVRAVYGEGPVGPKPWQDAIREAREAFEVDRVERRRAADAFRIGEIQRPGRSLGGWISAGAGDADDTRAGLRQVRDSPDTLEVLVVQRRADGTLATVPWLSRGRGAREIPTDAVPPSELARTIAACALRLPFEFTWDRTAMKAIEELEADVVPAWQAKESTWLAGELVLVLDQNCRRHLAGFDLEYAPEDGLKVNRAD